MVEGYGSSENAIIIVPVPRIAAGALGVPPTASDVAVVDPETGEECPRAPLRRATAGCSTPTRRSARSSAATSAIAFEGYYNNPEADAERTRNGWYWSGDLGYRDDDGVFYFAGRTGDWLRVDGENFAAAPVERILRATAGPGRGRLRRARQPRPATR